MFPGRGCTRYPGEALPSVEQVDEALDTAELVVISNPQMPFGITLDRDALAASARRHPASTLVVDESAIDFLADPASATLVGTDADNVIALRSSASSTASPRPALAWPGAVTASRCAPSSATARHSPVGPRRGRRRACPPHPPGPPMLGAGWPPTWPGSTPSCRPSVAAWSTAGLPYRCIVSDTAGEWAAALAAAGIVVRVLGPGHGVHPGALGIFAPLEAERPVLATAIGATHANPPAFSEAG